MKEPFPYSAISEMQPVPPQEFFDAQERIASERVKAVVGAAADAGVTCHAHTVEALHPWEAILDHAKTQACDLIVMASHGRRGLSALLLGSETQKVLTHSSIPVLVDQVDRRRSPADGRVVGRQCACSRRIANITTLSPPASQASCEAVSRQGRRRCICGSRSATAT